MAKPPMPRALKRAVADLVRFGSIKIFNGRLFAADAMHLPELAHDPKAIAAVLSERLGARQPDGSIAVTDKGRAEWAKVEAEAVAP